MSHFSVTVILPPNAFVDFEQKLAEALQPFHEFECTGTDDQYVQEIDQLEELRAEFAEARRKLVRLDDGTVVDRYHAECFREPTPEELAAMGPLAGSGGGNGLSWHSQDWGDGRGYRAKIHQIPVGAEEFEAPYDSMVEFYREYHSGKVVFPWQKVDLTKEHKYGYALADDNGNLVKVVRRTNPNRKWDWWVVGGRWSGHFACIDPEKDLRNYEVCSLCHGTGKRNDDLGREERERNPAYTCNGCSGKGMALKFPTQWARNEGDVCTKADIRFDDIRAKAESEAAVLYDAVHAIVAGRDIPSWDEVRAAHTDDISVAREVYHSHPVSVDIRKSENRDLVFLGDLTRFRVTRDEFLTRARNSAVATFAVLHEGQWFQRGEMGWWGSVSDEKDGNDWSAEYNRLMDSLSDDTIVAVVDCHI